MGILNQASSSLVVQLSSNEVDFIIENENHLESLKGGTLTQTVTLTFGQFIININSSPSKSLENLDVECKRLVTQLSLDLKNEIHKSLVCKHIFEYIIKRFKPIKIVIHNSDPVMPYFILKSLSLGQSSFLSPDISELRIIPGSFQTDRSSDIYDQYSVLLNAVSQENVRMINQLQFNRFQLISEKKFQDFDVIIPTLFKNAGYLIECLRSIHQGSILPKEIIFIVPDAVTFQREFLSKFESQIEYRVLQGSDKGVGPARQIGLLESASGIVAFVDDDDTVEPEYFERLLTALHVNESLDAVGCWLASFGYSKIVLPQFDSLPIIGVINCCPPAGILMWRKTSILAMGGFDQAFVHGYEDFDLVSRATVAKMQIKVIDEPLYNYRRHKNSTSSNYNFEIESKLRDLLFKKITDSDTIQNVARLLFVSDRSVKISSPFYWRNEKNYMEKRLSNNSLIRRIYYKLPSSIRLLIYNFLKSL